MIKVYLLKSVEGSHLLLLVGEDCLFYLCFSKEQFEGKLLGDRKVLEAKESKLG